MKIKDFDDIDAMLDACEKHVKGSALNFIESLREWYEEHGELTDAQLEALQKFYGNCNLK
jgi:hypothetical protein